MNKDRIVLSQKCFQSKGLYEFPSNPLDIPYVTSPSHLTGIYPCLGVTPEQLTVERCKVVGWMLLRKTEDLGSKPTEVK